MPNDFHRLMRLQANPECSCRVVDTGFPAGEAEEDGDGRSFNPSHWAKVTDGPIVQDGGGLYMADAAKLKWIGTCQRHSAGLAFRIVSDVDASASGSLYYACDADLAPESGYLVQWQTVLLNDLPGNLACNVKIRYQLGTPLVNRMLRFGDYGGDLFVAFEHVSDEDGGGVHITINDSTFTHLEGPQVTDEQWWGIGAGGPVTFTVLQVDHNGNVEGGRFCRDCPPVTKNTDCDFSVGCGGGTYRTQPGETLIDYDYGEETCGTDITPHHQDGWYLECDGSGDSKDYAQWTFTELAATFDFTGHGHCGTDSAPDETTGFNAWRFVRLTGCDNTVTLTIVMDKSKYIVAAAAMEITPVCGVHPNIFDDISPTGVDESWSKSTASITDFMTCSSTSSSNYFKTDACVAEENDTVTVDIERLPPGIYKVRASVVSVGEPYTAAPSACSTESIVAWPPVKYQFQIEGCETFDPICRG
jgi:hypothetical protein